VRGLDTVALLEGGARFYYHHDRLGSVTALTSASGASEWLYGYEPFGSPRTTSRPDPAAPLNPLGFTGQYQDPGSGLLNLRARQYDEASGRFQSTDPAPAGPTEPYTDPYDYAGQDPINNYDLDGQNFRHWLHKHVVKPLADTADVGAPLAAGIVVGGIVGVVCVPCGIAAGAAAAGGASFLTHHYVDKESAGKSGRAAAFDAALSVGQDVGGRWLGKQLAGEFHFTVDPPYRPVYRAKAHSSKLYFAGVSP
jgi:RHS repeat-associated protein